MVKVRLRNPDIILMPITDEEKKEIEERTGNENIYILYRLPNSEGIHIGMMSSSMRKYYPAIANV